MLTRNKALKSNDETDQYHLLSIQQQKRNSPKKTTGILDGSIIEPLKLKILILSGTEIIGKELESIHSCVNLIKLDISGNAIKFFPKSLPMKKFTSLKLLYLHDNAMEDIESLYNIFETPNLRYLTLFNNPISQKWSLRHFIVNSMRSLFALDFYAIADEERMESATKTERFYALSPSTKIIWPIVSKTQGLSGSDPLDESLTQFNSDDGEYLRIMREEMKLITSKFSENSPSTIIQRVWRGYECRKALRLRLKVAEDQLKISQKVSAHWKRQTIRKSELKQVLQSRNKQYLLYETSLYQFHRGKDKLKAAMRQYVDNFRLKKKQIVAGRIVLKTFLRMRQFLNSCETLLFSQSLSSGASHPVIYFKKSQLELFKVLLASSRRYIYGKEKNEMIQSLEDMTKDIDKYTKNGSDVVSLRLVEQISQDNQSLLSKYPFNALSRPSLKSKVLILPAEKKYYEMKTHPFLSRFKREITLASCTGMRKPTSAALSAEEEQRHGQLCKQLQIFQEKAYDRLLEINFPHPQLYSVFCKTVFTYNFSLLNRTTQPPIESNFLTCLNEDEEFQLSSDFPRQVSREGQSGNFEQLEAEMQLLPNLISSEQQQQQQQQQAEQVQQPSSKQSPEIFLVFFKHLLERVSAAMKIQKVWRQMLIYKKNEAFNVFTRMQTIRACLRIQHWLRNLRWRHRRSFFSRLSSYVSLINQHTFYIHFGVYHQLKNIVKTTQSQETFTFREQQSNILFNSQTGTIQLVPDVQCAMNQFLNILVSRNKLNAFPSWTGIKDENETFSKYSILEKEVHLADYLSGDVMHLLQLNTRTSIVQLSGMKFVKIEFAKIEQARYRAAILALLTYKFQSNCFFVKLFNWQEISTSSYILEEETQIRLAYDIDLPYDKTKCATVHETTITNSSYLFLANEKQKTQKYFTGNNDQEQAILSQNVAVTTYGKAALTSHPARITSSIGVFLLKTLFSRFIGFNGGGNQGRGREFQERLKQTARPLSQNNNGGFYENNQEKYQQLQDQSMQLQQGILIPSSQAPSRTQRNYNRASSMHNRTNMDRFMSNNTINENLTNQPLTQQQAISSTEGNGAYTKRQSTKFATESDEVKIKKERKSQLSTKLSGIQRELQQVEVLREIAMHTKNEGKWAENFNRSQNYLGRQITELNKQNAKDSVLARNSRKARMIRQQKSSSIKQELPNENASFYNETEQANNVSTRIQRFSSVQPNHTVFDGSSSFLGQTAKIDNPMLQNTDNSFKFENMKTEYSIQPSLNSFEISFHGNRKFKENSASKIPWSSSKSSSNQKNNLFMQQEDQKRRYVPFRRTQAVQKAEYTTYSQKFPNVQDNVLGEKLPTVPRERLNSFQGTRSKTYSIN